MSHLARARTEARHGEATTGPAALWDLQRRKASARVAPASAGAVDQILALRSRLRLGYRLTDWLRADVEIQDSRAFLEDGNAPINTGLVNTAALLQAFAQVDLPGPLGGDSEARLGRLTMDVGSRRFVSRSGFRNTATTFTGLDWVWKGAGFRRARAFYTLPVQRLSDESDRLRDGEWDFDEESFDQQFWGLYFRDELPESLRGEIYWLGLHERDDNGQPTSNRDFQTPGFRIWRTKGVGDFRIRWMVLPKNLRLETGYAHLFAGRFIDEAPNSNREGDSNYAYAQTQLWF